MKTGPISFVSGKSHLVVLALCGLLLLLHGGSLCAHQAAPPDWSGCDFLVGEWIGEGGGMPGEAAGGFTLAYDLQKTILVRKNFADYPATKERPAFRHDDLMVMYQEAGKIRAVYFDNERHVIHYNVAVAKESSSIVFLSDPDPSAPRFRMTYTRDSDRKVRILFEIAPPGKPEAFSKYIEASARRK